MRPALISLCLLAIATAQAPAQVIAEHATTQPENEFDSPMKLTVPLPRLATMQPGVNTTVPDLSHYFCDDVHLVGISLSRLPDRSPKTVGTGRYELRGQVCTRRSHDREVDVRAEILDGDALLGWVLVKKIDAEEKKCRDLRMTVTLTAAAQLRLAASNQPALRFWVGVDEALWATDVRVHVKD
jgi:hypothetical protein